MHKDKNGIPVPNGEEETPLPAPPDVPAQPQADTVPFPTYGDPRFWELLPEWIVEELRYGVNWATFFTAALEAVMYFKDNLGNGSTLMIVIAILGALQVFARSQASSGVHDTSTMAKARERVQTRKFQAAYAKFKAAGGHEISNY